MMLKRIRLFIIIITIFLSISGCASDEVQQQGLTIIGDSVEVDFPLILNFSVKAESDVDISDIRLHYKVDRMTHADVTSEILIGFEHSDRVEADWTWDTRKTGGLPPGSSLKYWWTVTDVSGKKATTELVTVQIEDERFDWKEITNGKITILWYTGNDVFAEELMSTVKQALVRLEEYTGAILEKPVRLYVYANSNDLKDAMVFPQEWTGGVAFTRHGIIAIGIEPDNLEWGKSAIAHELTHLVIHQMTFNPYGELPTWLDEGLAMNAEGDLGEFFSKFLKLAADEDQLITVRSLSSPFSAFAEESALSYAQSYSIVKFLVDGYGSDKMFELLNVFAEGNGSDEALLKVYGFDMDELNTLWREYIETGSLPEKSLAGVGGVYLIVNGVLAVAT